MTNTPGSGWPGAPPPQGPGGTPPWGAQPWPPAGPGPHGPAQPAGGQPHPGPHGQPYPGHAPSNPSQQQPYPPNDQGSPGFDPRQAIGAPPPASVSINQFAPPPNRTPLLITLAALVTLVLVIGGGIYVRSLPAAEPSPSPSPSQTAAAGPGHPFSTPDERKGRWEILDSVWTDEGLQLQIRIYSDSGTISFSFMAFSNASTEVVTPTNSPRTPDIRKGIAYFSDPVTGYVFFPMARGDATIILATGTGRQMSALPVKG